MQQKLFLNETGKRFFGCIPEKNGLSWTVDQQPPSPGFYLPERPLTVYYRISKKASTTESQEYAMSRHLATLAGRLVVIRKEHGSSWRKKLPILQEIIQQIRKREISELHLWRVDRTGRHHKTDVDLWDLCVECGVRLFYVDDNLSSDREEDKYRFYELSNQAEKERYMISRRVKERFALNRKKDPNWKVGGRKPGALNRDVLAKVPDVLLLRREGRSMRKICKNLHLEYRTLKKILRLHGDPFPQKEEGRDSTSQV